MLGGDEAKAIGVAKIIVHYAKNLGFILGDGKPQKGLVSPHNLLMCWKTPGT